jgi:hypothetical protein
MGKTNTSSRHTFMSDIPGDHVPPKTSGLAIWSLVLGILSLFCFSIFAAIPGVICGHKALSRIKRSGGAIPGQGLAIGGLVTGYIGIALSLIMVPLMLAIAVPNFIRARDTAQKHICENNLRQIQDAKQQWATKNKKEANETPTESDLIPYLNSGMQRCPAGGNYKLNAVSDSATCSIPTHKVRL